MVTEQRHHHHRWRRIVLVALLLAPPVVVGGNVLAAALFPVIRDAYIRGIIQTGKEPAFLVTLSFLLTFGVVRLVTYAIRDHALPLLHNVTTKSGLHIH